MKYSEWLETWLALYVKPVVKSKTYDRYQRIVLGKLIIALGEIEVEELTTIELQKCVVKLSQSGYAANTVNGIVVVIKSSLKSAVVAGVIKQNPADGLIRPKREEKKVECFSISEQKKIENYILKNKLVRLYGVVITLYTGLRIGELLALKWSEVDFVKSGIYVVATCHDSWQDGKYIKISDNPKTETSKRVIPVSKPIIALLREMKKNRRNDFVVSGRTEYGAEVRSYQKTFEKLLKQLNIPHKGFHSLRHTFATRALECGMDIKTLSEILGHKNTSITLNRYVHSMDERKVQMMNKLGKLLQ